MSNDRPTMLDKVERRLPVGLALAAAAVVGASAPGFIRTPIVLAFTLVAPGLAASRHLPRLRMIDQLAVIGSLSVAVVIASSLALLSFDAWTSQGTQLLVSAFTLFAALGPSLRRRAEPGRGIAEAQVPRIFRFRRR